MQDYLGVNRHDRRESEPGGGRGATGPAGVWSSGRACNVSVVWRYWLSAKSALTSSIE